MTSTGYSYSVSCNITTFGGAYLKGHLHTKLCAYGPAGMLCYQDLLVFLLKYYTFQVLEIAHPMCSPVEDHSKFSFHFLSLSLWPLELNTLPANPNKTELHCLCMCLVFYNFLNSYFALHQ